MKDKIILIDEVEYVKAQDYIQLQNSVKNLLLFCEADNEVVNGFRTKEIIEDLKKIVKQKKLN